LILEQVIQILEKGKRLTLSEISERVPDLAEHENAVDILRLLLRLDKRFEQDGDLWYYTDNTFDPVSRILDEVAKYFKNSNKKGELLEHLAQRVSQSIGEDIYLVKDIIPAHYKNLQDGKMILNQRKELT
jgi:hypothetical protein